MNNYIILKLKAISKRYKKLEYLLSKGKIIANNSVFLNFSKEYSKLSVIIKYFTKWKKNKKDIKNLLLLLNDKDVSELAKQDLKICLKKKNEIEKKIKSLLVPKDVNDKHSCLIEIRAGTGGTEAAIFASDLFKMYIKYTELRKWKYEVMSRSEIEHGGFKEIIIKIVGKYASGDMKFESGGHRVQRVPLTESQGRVHTSTCTVAVMPVLPKEKRPKINSSDLKIDTFRSSGAGGQHVNTTDSAIRITHLPTNIVVECQDERSQHKNKAKALLILSARIYAKHIAEINKKNACLRKNLLGSGDRSDRNRTYNFPQNRVTDHRINLTLYRLDEIMNGNLDILIKPIIEKHNSELFKNIFNLNNI
ncbi:peptide chain release factor 1 [Buchnera aphidicola (Taiwanaphis decaspermi)]|uniref:peptide chain release factor 1 n=1 Tax=Buchnera aphidicola TaxID=9 RepID=UPI0031B8AA21